MKANNRVLTNAEKLFRLVDHNIGGRMFLDESRQLLKFGVKLYVADRQRLVREKNQREKDFYDLAELVCNYLNTELIGSKELTLEERKIIDYIDAKSPWDYLELSKKIRKLHKRTKAKKTEEAK